MNKKLLAALTVPGLVFGGAAVAGAQTSDDDTTVPDAEASESAGEHHRHGRRGGPLRGFAEAIGMDATELREALQSGSTLAEIAEAEGADIDAIIADLVAQAQAKADENPDSPRAQNFDADQLTERLQGVVNGEVDFERGPRGPKRGFGGSAITEALGLERGEIREALQDGSTIADLAEQQGVDINAVIAGIVDDAEAKVAENPDSRFAQNFDADELEQRLTDVVNGDAEFPGRGGRGGPGGHGRGPGGGAPAGVGVNA